MSGTCSVDQVEAVVGFDTYKALDPPGHAGSQPP